MRAGREHINAFFNGRPFMLLCAALMAAQAMAAASMGCAQPPGACAPGLLFTLSEPLIAPGALSAAVNLACLLLTGGIMLAVNKLFTFARSMTHLFVSAFFLLQAANPLSLTAFCVGTLLCLVTAAVVLPLFASYQDRHAQRSVFLVFALASAGSLFHCAFLLLVPACLLGFAQMRSLGVKGFLAMLFGLLTPWWIVLGLGVAEVADFVPPRWLPAAPALNPASALAATAVLAGGVLAILNLHIIVNYRLQTRVYNLFFVTTLALTALAVCLDFNASGVFMPLLGLLVAVQVALYHTLHTSRYRYVFLLLFTAACIASAVVNMILP